MEARTGCLYDIAARLRTGASDKTSGVYTVTVTVTVTVT